MLAEERLVRISDALNRRGSGVVAVAELSERLGVSPMTVRRDLDRLADLQIVRRVHGGAIAVRRSDAWPPFARRHVQFSREKEAIGRAAASLVRDGEVILLDAGTTTPYVARALADLTWLTVVTNSLPVADELADFPRITTVLLGGNLRHWERYTCGPAVLRELAHLSVERFFLSAAGLTIEHGPTDPDPQEVEIKLAMARAAREVTLVVDHSKWGHVRGAQILPLSGIQRVVTDDGIPAQAVGALAAAGVDVLTAPVSSSGVPSGRGGKGDQHAG